MLAGCQAEGEDLLYLVVVLDGGVEELCVLGGEPKKKQGREVS